MTKVKITGAILQAIKRSNMTEAEILERLAPKKDAAADEAPAPAPRARRGGLNRRDMRADA